MPFKKGQGGRPRGVTNKATPFRELLDSLAFVGGHDLHAQRLHKLTQSDDEHVAIKALALGLSYRWGKPIERHEVTGADGGPIEVHDHFATPASV